LHFALFREGLSTYVQRASVTLVFLVMIKTVICMKAHGQQT